MKGNGTSVSGIVSVQGSTDAGMGTPDEWTIKVYKRVDRTITIPILFKDDGLFPILFLNACEFFK